MIAVTLLQTKLAVSAFCPPGGSSCQTNLPTPDASSANLQHLLTIAFSVLGALAVLMIVIAALNFVNAQGDSQKVAKARGTIIYALVGLIICISAVAIVNFVLGGVN